MKKLLTFLLFLSFSLCFSQIDWYKNYIKSDSAISYYEKFQQSRISEEKMKFVNRAIEIEPNNFFLYSMKSQLYYNDNAAYEKLIIELTKKFPNEGEAFYTLGFYQEKNKNEFMREPYGVYFKSGNFDFVLVIAHSIFGDNEKQRLIEGSNYANVYKYFKEKSGEEDIILAGDFNLPADSLAFRNLKLMYNVEYLIDPLKNPTTISDNKLANSYDNFFINKK